MDRAQRGPRGLSLEALHLWGASQGFLLCAGRSGTGRYLHGPPKGSLEFYLHRSRDPGQRGPRRRQREPGMTLTSGPWGARQRNGC